MSKFSEGILLSASAIKEFVTLQHKLQIEKSAHRCDFSIILLAEAFFARYKTGKLTAQGQLDFSYLIAPHRNDDSRTALNCTPKVKTFRPLSLSASSPFRAVLLCLTHP